MIFQKLRKSMLILLINFLNDVELKGAKVYSIDTTTDVGLRVTGLGGIISLLRFSVEG